MITNCCTVLQYYTHFGVKVHFYIAVQCTIALLERSALFAVAPRVIRPLWQHKSGLPAEFWTARFLNQPKKISQPIHSFFFYIATHPKHWLFLRHLSLSWDRRVSSCALGRFQMQKNLLKDFHTFSMLSISLILYFSCLTFSVCSVSKPPLINFQVQIRIESCRLQMKTQNQTNRRAIWTKLISY